MFCSGVVGDVAEAEAEAGETRVAERDEEDAGEMSVESLSLAKAAVR